METTITLFFRTYIIGGFEKNLVFISPNFPTYYWNFCKSLRERGVTVLGIGDAPYDDLVSETRESLVEYYRVNNLQNYDEVYRAMGFFIG